MKQNHISKWGDTIYHINYDYVFAKPRITPIENVDYYICNGQVTIKSNGVSIITDLDRDELDNDLIGWDYAASMEAAKRQVKHVVRHRIKGQKDRINRLRKEIKEAERNIETLSDFLYEKLAFD